MDLIQEAIKYVELGFSVIPVSKDKRPHFAALPRGANGRSTWERFKSAPPSQAEVSAMFSHGSAGIAVIGGAVSRHLVQLDFEGKAGEKRFRPVYSDWVDLVRLAFVEMGLSFPDFWICVTPSGGYHVRWRVDEAPVLLTEPVAKGTVGTQSAVLLVETRNEGAYALVPPSPGYETISGDSSNVPMVDVSTHKVLMDLAMSFHSEPQPRGAVDDSTPADRDVASLEHLRPGTDYNERGDWRGMLVNEGWRMVHKRGDVEYWCRPGKDSSWSANWNYVPGRFHVFSSSVSGLEHRGTYDPFGLYVRLKHDGDFASATKALSLEGFGLPEKVGGPAAKPTTVEQSSGSPVPRSAPANGRDAVTAVESAGLPYSPYPVTADFPEAAFRSVFRIYREAYRHKNEVCDAYHFAVLKTVIGSVLGRGCYVYVGRRIYPNFYTCMLGPTGASRKSTALDYGVEILEEVDENVSFLTGLSTPEGLISKLATNEGDDGFVPSDTEGHRLLVALEEYAALLKKAKKQSSEGLIQLLTVAYDSPKRLDNPTRHSPLVAEHPCVSIVALSTLEWLESSLTLGDIQGGFANRFCYYDWQETEAVPRPSPGDEVQLGVVVDVLRGIRERFVGRHQGFTFTDEAGERVDAWYIENRKRILNERNELLRSLSQRLDINARRLSLLYAVLENKMGDFEIGIEQFEAALTVASYWRDVMLQVFSKFAVDLQSKNESRIFSQVSAHPDWTKREIQRSLSREMSAKDFNTCIEAMLVAEVLCVVEDGRRRLLRVPAD